MLAHDAQLDDDLFARRLQLANLPRDTWTVTLDGCVGVPGNKHALAGVSQYLADSQRQQHTGRGLSFVGPHQSGKTLLACLVLRRLLEEDRETRRLELRRDFQDVRRIDYQELISQALRFERSYKAEDLPPLLETLAFGQLVFLDNLFGPPPTPTVNAALGKRRDANLPTLLAFTANKPAELGMAFHALLAQFKGKNATLALEEEILPHLDTTSKKGKRA